MGVNCVPVKPLSINLFDSDEETTEKRLRDFMEWRNANELNILRAYVLSLEQFIKVPEKNIFLENALLTLRPDYIEVVLTDYINTVYMFKRILQYRNRSVIIM